MPAPQKRFLEMFVLGHTIPDLCIKELEYEEYNESNWTPMGKEMDEKLPMIRYWLQNPKTR